MPFFLRKIRKSKWYKHEGVSWLNKNELQADALNDLQTSSNTLSVYQVMDDKANLERVVTALGANGDFISNVDYVLFDHQILSELSIASEKSDGETADTQVNAWHFDLSYLTATKLFELAKAIFENGEKGRMKQKHLVQLITNAVRVGQIDEEKLREGVLKKIGIEK